jgi:hypothetical protein
MPLLAWQQGMNTLKTAEPTALKQFDQLSAVPVI